MQVRTRHTPSYGVARLVLAASEPARVDSGAMLATSYGVAEEPRTQGGLLKSTGWAAPADEPFPHSTYTAPPEGGWVDAAARLPGDVSVIDLDGRAGWCVAKGCWLASASTVWMETRWGGFWNLFGGEKGFLTHVTGHGPLVASCYGALDVVSLQAGELVTVDTGHLLAYEDTVRVRLRQRSQGATQSLASGEGLVLDFCGPGRVLTQTRDPRGLVSWLKAQGLGGR